MKSFLRMPFSNRDFGSCSALQAAVPLKPLALCIHPCSSQLALRPAFDVVERFVREKRTSQIERAHRPPAQTAVLSHLIVK